MTDPPEIAAAYLATAERLAAMEAALRAALPILEDEAECRLHSHATVQDAQMDDEALASMDADDRAYCLPILAVIKQARAALESARP